MLLCTVRTCHEPLRREARRYVCPRGHSFDIARSGYVNLLQPNERRSRAPGDSAEAVAARRRVWERFGVILSEAKDLLRQGVPRSARHDTVLDVGCGDGYWLSQIDAEERAGIDISVPAIEAAAKRYPNDLWIVANADRFIPFSDASFDAVMSITARLNDAEFRRVLRDDGWLLVAVAAPDDLSPRDRVPRTIDDFPSFTLLEHRRVTSKAMVDVADARLSTYRGRGARRAPEELTLSLDLLLFAPKSRGTPGGSSP